MPNSFALLAIQRSFGRVNTSKALAGLCFAITSDFAVGFGLMLGLEITVGLDASLGFGSTFAFAYVVSPGNAVFLVFLNPLRDPSSS
jgi:hypothetical protein